MQTCFALARCSTFGFLTNTWDTIPRLAVVGVAAVAAFAAGAAFVVAPARAPLAPTPPQPKIAQGITSHCGFCMFRPLASGASGSATQSAGWGLAAAGTVSNHVLKLRQYCLHQFLCSMKFSREGIAFGAHVGLAAAWRARAATAARAEGGVAALDL